MTTNVEETICAACQKTIPAGTGISIELEKYTPYERIFYACSEECAEILRLEE